jgi:hypothetical protein
MSIPLMNPNDEVVMGVLMSGNESGRLLITAKGPSLKFRLFDPAIFISPAINRGRWYSVVGCLRG